MGILTRFFPAAAPRNPVVARQISSMHFAQQLHLGDRGLAAREIADHFVDWLVGEIVTDENPDASAREFCRQLLSRVAETRRTHGGDAA